MDLCIGTAIYPPGWTGLPLGYFASPGHATSLPLAAAQDTLFVWNEDASPVTVVARGHVQHYERNRGVLDLMAARQEVSIRHDRPENPGVCLVIEFPDFVRERYRRTPSPRELISFDSRFCIHDEVLESMARLLEWQCRSGEIAGKLLTESVSSALVNYLEQSFASTAPAIRQRETTAGLSNRQRQRLVQYIEANISANIGLCELADMVDLSPSQLVRAFKRSFGVPPYKYVVERRIRHARVLLAEDTLPLADVALQCGFSSQSHFTAAFSARVGTTPRAYRNTL